MIDITQSIEDALLFLESLGYREGGDIHDNLAAALKLLQADASDVTLQLTQSQFYALLTALHTVHADNPARFASQAEDGTRMTLRDLIVFIHAHGPCGDHAPRF